MIIFCSIMIILLGCGAVIGIVAFLCCLCSFDSDMLKIGIISLSIGIASIMLSVSMNQVINEETDKKYKEQKYEVVKTIVESINAKSLIVRNGETYDVDKEYSKSIDLKNVRIEDVVRITYFSGGFMGLTMYIVEVENLETKIREE